METSVPPLPSDRGSLWSGLGIGLLMNLGMVIVSVMTITTGIGVILTAGFGLIQLAWILPLYFSWRRQGYTERAKGILIAAGITFLLSATCFGLLITGIG